MMITRATPSLRLGSDFILRPVHRRLLKSVVEAYQEDPEGAISALPWLKCEEDVSLQMSDFLFELEIHSNTGRIHFWSIHEKNESDGFVGMVGLGDELVLKETDWNLGYWVRPQYRRRGIAFRAVSEIFEWLISKDDELLIEVTVHPHNEAGLSTSHAICRKWGGVAVSPDLHPIEIDNRTVLHHIHVIPLPRDDGVDETE
ncbi:MAG: GNAT family N-acetyltransferase [Candidatus Poseidoniaceae archaeon]|nr:GNAT family N-acetyltransferase [Candidatus Poseidoniaceae archaeon]